MNDQEASLLPETDWRTCPNCQAKVPQFRLSSALEDRLLKLLSQDRRSGSVWVIRNASGCDIRTAKTWVAHQGLRCFVTEPPCPYCGKALRTPHAKQCRFCGRDWHSGPLEKLNDSEQRLLRIPSEADWGDYRNNLDQEWAHGLFAGKRNDEMHQHFRELPIEAASELRFMPEVPFRYYMLGFRDCIMASPFEPCNDSDAASCFLRLVAEKLATQPRYILPIMPELLPSVEHVAHNQAAFGADEGIYGNFLVLLKLIQGLYEDAQDTYRSL